MRILSPKCSRRNRNEITAYVPAISDEELLALQKLQAPRFAEPHFAEMAC